MIEKSLPALREGFPKYTDEERERLYLITYKNDVYCVKDLKKILKHGTLYT